MRTLVLALSLAATSVAAGAQAVPATPGATLTLDDAISIARRNNPTYLSQANQRRTADAAVRSARGALLPSADASFGTRYQQGGGQQVFNGLAFENSSSDALQSNYALTLNYHVNRATFVQPKAAAATRDAVEADIAGSAEGLRAAVTQQYLTVLQAQARAALQDTLVATAKAQLDLAQAKVAVGSGTVLDIRRAEVALGQTQVALLRERNNVEVERLRLYQQLGVDPAGRPELTTDFRVAPPSFGLDTLLDLARSRNPAIVALRSRERAADYNTKVARAAYTPTLNVSTGWGGNAYQYTNSDYLVKQQQGNLLQQQSQCFLLDSLRQGAGLSTLDCNSPKFTLSDAQRQALIDQNSQFPFRFNRSPWALTASLSIPVFDNFQREEHVQRAEVDREDAAFNVRAKDLAITADVTQAYLTLNTAAQSVALQEQTAAKAKEEVTFAVERYKVGAATFLDVTTARSSYEQALIDRVNAVYEYHKAFAALENAVGRPLR